MTPTANDRVLFSWLHLSDIHFGHGDDAHKFSQKRVVRELLEDIEDLLKPEQAAVPAPQVILLTGDIAFKGSSSEYEDAEQWLLKLLGTVRLKRRNLFVIPGNHDVQRTLASDRQALRLVNALRAGEAIDPALRDPIDRATLTHRFENYLAFANEFAPASMNPMAGAEQWLFWSHRLQPQPDFRVHLLGLNSALLCNDDFDSTKLVLGPKQMSPLIDQPRRPGEIVMVLTHHPIEDLQDAASEHVEAIEAKADLHLSGHVHDPSVKRVQQASGSRAVHIVAGAVHGEAGLRDQGYSFGAIIEKGDKSLEVRVWPRTWFARAQKFDWNNENTVKGKTYARFALESTAALSPDTLPGGSVALLDPLPGYRQPKTSRADILDPESARDWLSMMGLGRRELLLPGNAVIEGGGKLEALPQPPADPWNAFLIQQICDLARRSSKDNLTPFLLHGIRGVGKSLLALRYVAGGNGSDARLFVDCGSNPDNDLSAVGDELKTQLRALSPANGANSDVFIAIDGLDIACRSQIVREGKPDAKILLEPQIGAFRDIVSECLPNRRVYLMFTSDDAPASQAGIASSESWATECFRKVVVKNWRGLCCRLDPCTVPGPGEDALRQILPHIFAKDPWIKHPFLVLPVFLDAIRNAKPADLPKLSTRRHFLELGVTQAKVLGTRRHIYYKTLEDVNRFIKAVNALPAVPIAGDTSFDDCVSLIEKELTGDWMYLFELSKQEEALVGRLEELHRSLIEEGWRHSGTYALSNVVSVLALLGRFHVDKTDYLHCNLRNAQIINAAQIISSQFHGVDFGGAKILGATIVDGRFVGVDFSGASFENSVLKGKSVFVGCRFYESKFDQKTLANVKAEPDVKFIESIPEGWTPGS